MASIQTLLSELATKLTPRARDELDRLIATPEAEAMLARDEESTIVARRLLAKRLAEVGPKYAAAQVAAGKRAEAAALAIEAAQKQLADARDEVVAATAQSIAASSGEADERQELERELREGADTRLEQFALHAEDLAGMGRHLLVATPVAKRSWVTGEKWTEIVTNATEVQAARDALMAAASTARAMRLEARESSAVTEWLQSTLAALEPALRPFRLDMLALDEHGVLQRDKSVPRRQIINGAIRANGGTTNVPDELPGIDPAPNRHRAERALGLLA